MCRRLIFLISFVFVLGLVNYASAAYNAVIPQGTPTTIDGVRESEWLISAENKIDHNSVGGRADDAADLSCSFLALWDADYLYVFVDVNDCNLWNDSSSGWDDDSVEIFIDIGNDKQTSYGDDDFQYRASWNANPMVRDLTCNHDPGAQVGVVYKLLTKNVGSGDGGRGTGYTLEIKFPWTTLDPTGRGLSVTSLFAPMGFELQINDDDNGDVRERSYAWINTSNVAWNNPSTFGTVQLGPGLKACGPHPSDDEEGVRSGLLQWTPGKFANSHKVYFDDDQAKVVARSGCDVNAAPLNVPNNSYVVSIEPNTTYYWAIDEVNGAGQPPPGHWAGDVWTFTTAPAKATIPDPCDKKGLVDLDQDLFWNPGFYAQGTQGHKVYFDPVKANVVTRSGCEVNGVSCNDPCYPLATLDPDTTYYWAIDEVNVTGPDPCKWAGDVWEFTTVLVPGQGHILCEIWTGLVSGQAISTLTSTAKYINDMPDASLLRSTFEGTSYGDLYGTRLHGWLYIFDTHSYTFWIASDEYSELWLSTDDDPENAVMIASVETGEGYTNPHQWTKYPQQQSAPITLQAGKMYYVMALHKENYGADHVEVAWNTTADPCTAQVIAGKYLVPYAQNMSFRPTPLINATDVQSDPNLIWSPGKYTGSKRKYFDVYFGTDKNAVKDASRTSDPCGVLVMKNLNCSALGGTMCLLDITNDPNYGDLLEFDTTYYWRVDDVNMNVDPYPHIWKGRLWSFTTGKYHLVDNFEKYANTTSMQTVWSAKSSIKAASEIVCGQKHNGSTQAIALNYDCSKSPYYRSEAYANTNKLRIGTNWRLKDAKAVSLWFRGIEDLQGSKSGTDPYTLIGDGSGISGSYDIFYYFYRVKSTSPAEGLVAARVDSIENTDPSAMAGVMIRGKVNAPPTDGLDPTAVFAAVVVTPDNRVIFRHRDTAGSSVVTDVNTVSGITMPHWVRIYRQSASPYNFFAQHANDVSNHPQVPWKFIGKCLPTGITFPIYLGLCDTSNVYGEMCTAQFKYVDVNAPTGTRVLDPDTTKDIGGYVYNAKEPMYMVLQDSPAADGNAVVYYENKDANVTQIADWTEWRIDINDFITKGIDPCNVLKMFIGIGNKDNPAAGGTGTMYFDDIRLYIPAFYEPECPPLPADLVRDGEVNYDDLKVIADNWLIHDYDVTPVAPPTGPVAWYKLDRDPCDSAGPPYQNGVAYGIKTADYVTDKKEGTYALDLKGDANYIGTTYKAVDYGIEGKHAKTITAWAKTHTFDDQFRGLYELGGSAAGGQDFSMLTSGTEPNVWRANHEGGPEVWDMDFEYPSLNEWVHLTQAYDGTTVRVYADGYAVAGGERVLDLNTTNTRTFSIGRWIPWGNYYFDGIVDDVRIYDYALTQANAAYIANYPDANAFAQPLALLLTPPEVDLYSKDSVVSRTDPYINVTATDTNNVSGVTWTADPCAYPIPLGQWYRYTLSGWWNVWLDNRPYNLHRWKEIYIDINVAPITPGTVDYRIKVGGSTGAWAATVNGNVRPPLPSDVNATTESLYIDRTLPDVQAYRGSLTTTKRIRKVISIENYNPAWVFVDIRAQNFKILNGHITHECRLDIINLRDFAELGKHWGEKQVWPTWDP